MKVRTPTVEVDDEVRRAIRSEVGKSGLATRAEVKAWVEQAVGAAFEDLMDDYRANLAESEVSP